MQTSSLLNIIAGDQNPGKVYRRLVYLALVVIVLLTLAILLLNTHQAVNHTLSDYSKGLGRDIAQQYSALLAKPVNQQEPENADVFMQSLVQQSHILAASVFDRHGQLFVSHPKEQDFISLYQSQQAQQLLTFIQPIMHEGKQSGYLRIIFDHGNIQTHQEQLNSIYGLQTKLLMVLSALVAFLLTRKFYVWRLRRFYVRKKPKTSL